MRRASAYYFPQTGTGLQLFYRYYWDMFPGGDGVSQLDPWALRAHTLEGRVYQTLTPDLEIRVLFRYHRQNHAQFWCDAILVPGCYAPGSMYYSTDPKLGPLTTKYPEVKLVWDATALRDIPFFRWFAGRQLRDLLRLLHADHQLRRCPPAADRLPFAVLIAPGVDGLRLSEPIAGRTGPFQGPVLD